MIRTIRSHIPLIVLHTILLLVFLSNIKSGNTFVGWDSVNPELNFPLNFQRALTSGWQEYYGVGLLGGHGFVALLPHTTLMYLISLFVPQWAIRTIFTYLALYVGTIGCYVFIRYIFKILQEIKHTLIKIDSPWFALIGSLYYLFNLATVQQIYTQTEAFTFHFAALPWLFLGVLWILHAPSPSRIFLFVGINLLASGQGFVPPIFASYVFSLLIFLVAYVVYMRTHHGIKRRALLIVLITLLTNAYWLGPFSYYTLTGKQSEFLQSHNNRMQTVEFVEKSRKYGDLNDVALLKGFFWEGTNGAERIMQLWINHYQNPLITAFGYGFFTLGLCGLLFAIFKSKNSLIKAFGFVYAFFFLNIAIETPPFSYIVGFLRTNSPLFEQVFRNSFTKFSLGLGFAYSVCITLGLWAVFQVIKKRVSSIHITQLTIGIVVLCIIVYGLPAIQGDILYQKLQVKVPQQYTDVITYFKSQPDGRIADFPQDCAEGWYSYDWGYFGSGFLWYGVKQPFLSRTFDVWSSHNEQYYWEISQAVRQQDVAKFDSVLKKYDVKWILYDPNMRHCRDQKVSLKQEDFMKELSKSGEYMLKKTFAGKEWSPIYLYEAKNPTSNTFVSVVRGSKNVKVPLWTDSDQAHIENTTYVTNPSASYDSAYPFQGLFTKRGEMYSDTTIHNKSDTIRLTSNPLSGMGKPNILVFDSPYITENVVYAEVSLRPSKKNPNIWEVVLDIKPPTIWVGEDVIYNSQQSIVIGEIQNTKKFKDIDVLVNTYPTNRLNDKFIIVLGTKTDNTIWVVEETQNEGVKIEYKTGILADTIGEKRIHIVLNKQYGNELHIESHKIPQLGYGLNPALSHILPTRCSYADESIPRYEVSSGMEGYTRMIDENSQSCLQFKLDSLNTEFGYVASIWSRNIEGMYPKIEIINSDQGVVLSPYIYNDGSKPKERSYIVPPGASYGLGYALTVVNKSLSFSKSINEIGNVEMSYIPFEFAQRLKVTRTQDESSATSVPLTDFDVVHPQEYIYKVNMRNVKRGDVIVLHQGFENGWLAYDSASGVLSALFGKTVGQHVLVNGWANGFILQSGDAQIQGKVTIIFWPQYLEFLGIAGTIFVVIGALAYWSLAALRKLRQH